MQNPTPCPDIIASSESAILAEIESAYVNELDGIVLAINGQERATEVGGIASLNAAEGQGP